MTDGYLRRSAGSTGRKGADDATQQTGGTKGNTSCSSMERKQLLIVPWLVPLFSNADQGVADLRDNTRGRDHVAG